jgi:hypothetical protein
VRQVGFYKGHTLFVCGRNLSIGFDNVIVAATSDMVSLLSQVRFFQLSQIVAGQEGTTICSS